jgi:N-acetylmuramoyl-L-alanine amidase
VSSADAGPPALSAAAPLTRVEAVARADRLAVEAARASGAKSADLYLAAADLRERSYRLEHKEADALEAAELLGAALRAAPERRCDLELRDATLEGERRGDPAGAYRRLYAERVRAKDARCRDALDRAMLGLAAYRPPSDALRAIETGAGAAATPAAASAALAAGPVVVPRAVPSATGPVSVTRIERYGAKDAARVVVHLTAPAQFQVTTLEPSAGASPRVVVDLPGVSYKGERTFAVGGLVERLRVGAEPARTRVVLDLATPAYRRVFYLPEPFRLVIDIAKNAPLAAGQGARSVRRVVLDPGHGGHDPGAVGPAGLKEKDVTLDIAHRAAPLLARELGVSTLLTRDGDVFVALDERTARANAFGADLLLSIHCNASEDGNGHGVMTFVLDESPDSMAARVAARENAASTQAGSELAAALSQFLDRGTMARSEHFASLLQRSTIASLGKRYPDVPDLGVRRAGFYVLAGAAMPAVLFESSFISNARGEVRLNTADYRDKLADGIVNAVRAYQTGK